MWWRTSSLLATALIIPAAAAVSAGPFPTTPQQEGQREYRYVRKGDTWYVEDAGRRYQLLAGTISLRFQEGTSDEAAARFLEEHGLRTLRVNRLGVRDVELGQGRDVIELLLELRDEPLLIFVEPNTTGEYVQDTMPIAEMVLQGQRFVRSGDEWYLSSHDRLYRVIPNLLSLRFAGNASDERRRELLDSLDLRVVRQNRLGIYDLELPAGGHAVEYYSQLLGNELLDFVEVATLGEYEGS